MTDVAPFKLGEMSVHCPPAPAGQTRLDIRFTYDTSGLLEVEAVVFSTGVRETLVIEGNPGVLSKQEIRDRLVKMAALKLHPREDAAHRALLARAQRLYEQRLGATRNAIGEALTHFIAALDSQEPDRIRAARDALQRVLDAHDDEFFL
jgi:molecular chaperone HscC